MWRTFRRRRRMFKTLNLFILKIVNSTKQQQWRIFLSLLTKVPIPISITISMMIIVTSTSTWRMMPIARTALPLSLLLPLLSLVSSFVWSLSVNITTADTPVELQHIRCRCPLIRKFSSPEKVISLKISWNWLFFGMYSNNLKIFPSILLLKRIFPRNVPTAIGIPRDKFQLIWRNRRVNW